MDGCEKWEKVTRRVQVDFFGKYGRGVTYICLLFIRKMQWNDWRWRDIINDA